MFSIFHVWKMEFFEKTSPTKDKIVFLRTRPTPVKAQLPSWEQDQQLAPSRDLAAKIKWKNEITLSRK